MIVELFLIMDLLKDTVGDTPISPPSTSSDVKIKGIKDIAGTAFGELKFKKFF